MSEESVSSRAVPYHCPYCGETDLWPHEPTGWECRGCRRAFKVELLGLTARPSATSTHPTANEEGGAS